MCHDLQVRGTAVIVIDSSRLIKSSAERNNRIFGLFIRNGDIQMFSSQ